MNILPHSVLSNLARLGVLAFAFTLLTGARGGCIRYQSSELVTVSSEEIITVEPYTPSETAWLDTGDLLVTYNFSGFNCWEMDVESIDISVSDSFGSPVVDVYDAPCSLLNELYLIEMPFDVYDVTAIARDAWGDEVLWYDGSVYHADDFTWFDMSLL